MVNANKKEVAFGMSFQGSGVMGTHCPWDLNAFLVLKKVSVCHARLEMYFNETSRQKLLA